MKPASFGDLPGVLQERLLHDMDLDYDSYESSMAEAIHCIMCGNISSRNQTIIDNYFKNLSCDTILTYAKQELDAVNRQANALTQLIRDCVT